MSADTELQKAIRQRLMNDAGLNEMVSSRIHDNPPRREIFPFIMMGDSELRDWPGGMEHLLELHVLTKGAGRAEAKNIMGGIYAALHDAALGLTGHRLINLRFLRATTRREADGETWRGTVRFRAVTEDNNQE